MAIKLPSFLRKPGWLSKDPDERRRAVASDDAAELRAELPRLAREDMDPQVRLAALRRLADPALAQGMARDDADAQVRTQARALWLDLLTGTHPNAPSASERLRLLRAQDDAELVEHIATRAAEPELRRAALERVNKQGVLLARAIEDADPAIRLALVERIDDEKQLERLAERARKVDKQVNRRARERIEELRIGRGHDATLEARARQLCEAIEDLVRGNGVAIDEAAVLMQWSAIRAQAPASLVARFDAALDLLAQARAPRPVATVDEPLQMPVADAQAAAASEGESADAAAASAQLAANMAAQARIAASLDEVQAARRQHREQQQHLMQRLHAALAERSAALEAGASARAHAAHAQMQSLRAQIDAPLPPALLAQINDSDARYAELSRWQHWADQQRRQQLCEEIEALPGLALHPDALAAKVRDAQHEWQLLDKIEAGSAHPGGLARRFHAGCRAALEPARGYFRKRQELREGHAGEVAALVGRIAALPAQEPDIAQVTALRRETADALRSLDRVEPRERKALAQSLKAALATLDAHVDARDAAVAASKDALIARAQALANEFPRAAAAAARDLQQQWRAAGNGRRGKDQAQWTQFRAAIDEVFAKLDAQRAERVQRDNEARAQIEALCVELEGIAAASEEPERGAISRIEAAWKALRIEDPNLLARHDAAQARLRERVSQRERTRKQARYMTWLARYRLCRAAETGGDALDLRSRWQEAPASDIAHVALARRFENALEAGASLAIDEDAHRDALVELEALARIDSPAEDQERRRMRQVERLAARMGGHGAAGDAQELVALLERWSTLSAAADGSLDKRLERALKAVLEGLG